MAEIKRTIQLASGDPLLKLSTKAELIVPRGGYVVCSTLKVLDQADSLQGKTLLEDVEYWSLGFTEIEIISGTGVLIIYERA